MVQHDHLNDDALVQLLPRSYREELGDILSAADLLSLVDNLGGTNVSVPEHPGADHPLSKALSPEGLAALCAYSPGVELMIPCASKLKRHLRNRSIVRMRAEGMTVSEIALKVNLHVFSVKRILAQNRALVAQEADRMKRRLKPSPPVALKPL